MADPTTRDALERLCATNPAPPAETLRAADAPAARRTLAEITARSMSHRRWPALVAAGAGIIAAVAGLVLAITLVPGTGDGEAGGSASETSPGLHIGPTAPATPEGRRTVIGYLSGFPRGAPNETVVPSSARVVFSWRSPRGEYTIWSARTEGPRGSATVYSSPLLGLSSSHGVGPRRPAAPFVFHTSGGAVPPLGIREVWGRASPQVARVLVVLKDGSRHGATLRRGWWVFSHSFGHPKPVALVGLDARGNVIVENRRPVF